MAKVRKAIIPAAGLGTRFLPATKTVPKEMLPIVDTPIIFYVIEEAVKAGIEDIILIAGRGKTAIEDFFDITYELEDQLAKSGKEAYLNRVKELREKINVISIRQKQALGLGHAIYTGHPIVGKEPFAVLLGDEIMKSAPDKPTVTQQLAEAFEQSQQSTVAVMEVKESEVSKYGIVTVVEKHKDRYKLSTVVEKPDPKNAPSRLALPGRYVFDSRVFDYLADTKPGKNGEIQLTDAMTHLGHNEGLWGVEFEATRFDAGDKLGYLKANIHWALEDPDLGPSLKEHLKELIAQDTK